jgi:hypothetical protein
LSVFPHTDASIFLRIVACRSRDGTYVAWQPFGKHVNDIRAVVRQLPITTIEKLLEAVFSVGSAPRLLSEETKPAESVQLWDIRPTVMTSAREAEESPLLEAVAKGPLLERQQDGKRLRV